MTEINLLLSFADYINSNKPAKNDVIVYILKIVQTIINLKIINAFQYLKYTIWRSS